MHAVAKAGDQRSPLRYGTGIGARRTAVPVAPNIGRRNPPRAAERCSALRGAERIWRARYGTEDPFRHPPRGGSADDTVRLAVPGKMFACSLAPFFRPLRKFRLRFFCRRQREAAIPPKGEARERATKGRPYGRGEASKGEKKTGAHVAPVISPAPVGPYNNSSPEGPRRPHSFSAPGPGHSSSESPHTPSWRPPGPASQTAASRPG